MEENKNKNEKVNESEKIRKVYLNDLPKHETKKNYGQINWSGCIEKFVDFQYDNIKGRFKIVGYNSKTQKITVMYNNKSIEISLNSFVNGDLQMAIGLKTKGFKYNIKDIIEIRNTKIKILEQIKMKYGNKSSHKGYKYQCQKCGNIDTITESHINYNRGCPVCSGQKVVKGINDIATTHPHLIKYFLNIEDAYKYSYGSEIKLPLICPNCKTINNNLSIHKLSSRGLSCHACSDGVSYSEKIMFNILKQIKINFKKEKVFEWSKDIKHDNPKLSGDKKYDFYIQSLNCIIETHGSQHYRKGFETCGGRTLEEEIENDRIKKELALANGIKEENYIVINCRKSELNWIKNKILKSKLPKILNFTENGINWSKSNEYACKSLIRETCDLWNSGIKDINKIALMLNTVDGTIIRYLKQGRDMDLCDYKTQHELKDENMSKACELWNSGNSTQEISNILNIEKYTVIKYLNECCNLKLCNYNGKEEITKQLGKKVMCVENNIVFKSIAEASATSLEVFGKKISIAGISQVCLGNRNSVYGYHFIYV